MSDKYGKALDYVKDELQTLTNEVERLEAEGNPPEKILRCILADLHNIITFSYVKGWDDCLYQDNKEQP